MLQKAWHQGAEYAVDGGDKHVEIPTFCDNP
jgi:hypothetical protein